MHLHCIRPLRQFTIFNDYFTNHHYTNNVNPNNLMYIQYCVCCNYGKVATALYRFANSGYRVQLHRLYIAICIEHNVELLTLLSRMKPHLMMCSWKLGKNYLKKISTPRCQVCRFFAFARWR